MTINLQERLTEKFQRPRKVKSVKKFGHILVGSTLATGIAFSALAGAGIGAAQAAPVVSPQQASVAQVAAKKSVVTMKTTANLNLRTGSTTKHRVVKVLGKGTKVQVLAAKRGWKKIKAGSKTGWVSSKYIAKVGYSTPKAKLVKPKNVKVSSSAVRSKIIFHAKKGVGKKYRWGGTSPKTGWDCSGYIQYVFKQSGTKIARTKAWTGKQRISKYAAKPGDLVVQNGGSHVGIYAGGDKMYHAANPKTGTAFSSTKYGKNTQYYKMFR